MDGGKLGEIDLRVKKLEETLGDKGHVFALEQYKILFSVIVSLNDSVVKSVLTIFIIFTTIAAIVFQNVDKHPQLKQVLYINYGLTIVFAYYLGYLRFRIVTMFGLVERIEKGEKLKYRGIVSYEEKTNWRFYSTKGLFWVVILSLIAINTLLIIEL
jgi:hypothetical protein